MSHHQEIIDLLPYKRPFLFVDTITSVDEHHIVGEYTIRDDEYFLEGHFPDNPIVPGVILIEIMAQIGLVSMGLFQLLHAHKDVNNIHPVFSSSKVEFTNITRPGDQLRVSAKKIYFRFNKLRCEVECVNLNTEKVVSKGTLDGLMIKKEDIEGK